MSSTNSRAMIYTSSKTYGHAEGLSCAFRQWRANHSHCRFLHGYAIAVHLQFASKQLDLCNWCYDFGGLKDVRKWLHEMYDHTTLIAADDPLLAEFERLDRVGAIKLRVVEHVGCEATARLIYEHVGALVAERTSGRVWLQYTEVREHEGNGATYGFPADGMPVERATSAATSPNALPAA